MTMSEPYLEVTYRRGRPLAAYLYLPGTKTRKSFKTREIVPGLLVDFSRSGTPVGIEITVPEKVTLTQVNSVLRDLGLPGLEKADLSPLRAA